LRHARTKERRFHDGYVGRGEGCGNDAGDASGFAFWSGLRKWIGFGFAMCGLI
jgi:hypothetical protein